MARKKVSPEEQLQKESDQMNEAQAAVEKLQQIKAIEDETRTMQQESVNRSHDTEFYAMQNTSNLEVIGTAEIEKAYQTLLKYKTEKATLETKIYENEEFWKMNHWNAVTKGAEDDGRVKPKSAWLFNTIINKHADAMDNYPEANILPRARDDEDTAKVLSSVIPVILEQNDYETVYSDCQWYKAKQGTSVQGVFWNNDKNNGLGDIEIKKIDLLNIFWKGGISDIQDSPNVFHVDVLDNDTIKELYPDIQVGSSNTLGFNEIESYGLNTDTSDYTPVIDWYYKKRVVAADNFGLPKTNIILHYCKFCNNQVIYASENDPNYADRGWYDHGLYPFVFDTLFPIEKSITGIGYIDIIKDDQIYIDKLHQAILESAIANARPRSFIRDDGSVNEAEYLNVSNPLVHVQGGLGEDSIRPIPNTPFNQVYESVLMQKISEMKDTSGNTASSQGQTSSVTSASGIASLQEAAGKLSRDANKGSYRTYRNVVNMVIELIRQFYNEPRCFRITGQMGRDEFVSFDNRGLLAQPQGTEFGIDLGERLPVVDIVVDAQKKSAYSKESQNQTALNLYNLGFFAPQNSDAALNCLDMMNFDDIQKVRDNIERNGTLYTMVMQMQAQMQAYQQQLMQLGAIADAAHGTNIEEGVAQEANANNASFAARTSGGARQSNSKAIETSKGSLSTQAASATRGSTAPR